MKRLPLNMDVVLVAILGLVFGYYLGMHEPDSDRTQQRPARKRVSTGPLNQTLNTWLLKKPEELEGTDIAELNLVCLAGLPELKNANLQSLEKRLDDLTLEVKRNTEEQQSWIKKNTNKQWPEGSQQMRLLAETIRTDYEEYRKNPAFTDDWKTFDKTSSRPDEIFFRGLLDWQNKPSHCNPVLFVSLARRMGYPVKLMTNSSYFLSRWESPDGRQNFNFDAGEGGYAVTPDSSNKETSFFMGFPLSAGKFEFKKLKTSAEEFAYFLYIRGIVLEERGYKEEARVAYAAAQVFDPNAELYQQALLSDIDRDMKYFQLDWAELEEINAEYFRLKKPDPIKPQLD